MSHTQRMENQTQQNGILTKANENVENVTTPETVKGVVLSAKDVEEYRSFKRKKLVDEIMAAMAKSGSSLLGEEDVQRVCERAIRLKQSMIQLPSSKLTQARKFLLNVNQTKSIGKIRTVGEFLSAKKAKNKNAIEKKIHLDCIVGGNGESAVNVKVYEAHYAIKNGAKEITVLLTPSQILGGKYAEIRKELRRLAWVSKRATLKVWVDNNYPLSTLCRLARISSEVGAGFFCVPYFEGCERIRFDLVNGCKLQVSGVETLADFKKMTLIGGRIISDKAYEIYEEWMQEAEKIEFAKPALLLKEKEGKENELQDKPAIEPARKTPLPASKVVQSGALGEREENNEKGIKIL